MLRLWVGGMEGCTKEAAVQMMYTDEEIEKEVPSFPNWPKVLYAVGVPLIWFWGKLFDSDNEEPKLPPAFDPEYFPIVFDYTQEEFESIFAKIT